MKVTTPSRTVRNKVLAGVLTVGALFGVAACSTTVAGAPVTGDDEVTLSTPVTSTPPSLAQDRVVDPTPMAVTSPITAEEQRYSDRLNEAALRVVHWIAGIESNVTATEARQRGEDAVTALGRVPGISAAGRLEPQARVLLNAGINLVQPMTEGGSPTAAAGDAYVKAYTNFAARVCFLGGDIESARSIIPDW